MLIVKWLTSKFLYLLKPYLIYQHPEVYRLVRSASMLATRTQFLQISELGYRIWFPSVWCGKYGGREIGWFWGAIVVYRETEIPICWVSFYGKSLDGSRSSNMCDFIVIDTLGLISKLLDIELLWSNFSLAKSPLLSGMSAPPFKECIGSKKGGVIPLES